MFENKTEQQAKEEILKMVEEYCNTYHNQKKAFQEGDRIPYASRVYDSAEMVNLVDSSLEFWLTAGRYTAQSEKAFAEGEQSGRQLNLINQVIKKVKKSKTLETIASELEEEEADIKPIYDAVVSSAPDYDINVIKDRLDNM